MLSEWDSVYVCVWCVCAPKISSFLHLCSSSKIWISTTCCLRGCGMERHNVNYTLMVTEVRTVESERHVWWMFGSLKLHQHTVASPSSQTALDFYVCVWRVDDDYANVPAGCAFPSYVWEAILGSSWFGTSLGAKLLLPQHLLQLPWA